MNLLHYKIADYTDINRLISNINWILVSYHLQDVEEVWNVLIVYLDKAIEKCVSKVKKED